MNIWSYKYNGKDYPFKLTRAARRAINELQYRIFDEMQNPEILTLSSELGILQRNLENAKREDNQEDINKYESKLEELSIKMMPMMKDFVKLQSEDIDPEEIAAILLKENKDLKNEMTDQFIDEMFDDMVDTMGIEKFDEQMVDITAKVFTVIQSLQDRLETVQSNTRSNNHKILPMS